MEEVGAKRCSRCGEVKRLEAFARRRQTDRQLWCQDCVGAYQRGRPRVHAAKRATREAKKCPCADCGIQYPHYVMDFDHRQGENKLANVSVLVNRGVPVRVILAEIAKCDVVCANYHRIRTYLRKQNYWNAVDVG